MKGASKDIQDKVSAFVFNLKRGKWIEFTENGMWLLCHVLRLANLLLANQFTPLMKSARAGDIGAMSALLKSGANIHDQDGLVRCSLFENSDTPGWSDHVYAPPLPLYKHGQTALSHACACGRTEAARFLIENGAQLDEPDLVSGSSNCIAFSMFIFDDDHDRLTV